MCSLPKLLLLFHCSVGSDSLDLMDCTPGSPVLHHLSEFAQIHVHWVSSFHFLPPSSPFAFNFSQLSGSFPMSWLCASGGQNIGASASASVLPMNIEGWFPLGLTGLISLQSREFSRIFSSATIQRHQFFGPQPSLGPTLTSIHDYWKNHNFDFMDLFQQSGVFDF